MANIYVSDLIVPRTARNHRIYSGNFSATGSTAVNGSSVDLSWVSVSPDMVTINRHLHVAGTISASEDVIAYVASAVSSDVLAALTATAPLRKSSTSNLVLDYNTNQFEILSGGLSIKAGVLTPSAHSHAIADVIGLQTALDGKLAVSLKGSPNGLAELDGSGKVLSSQLPSYVDDVIEVTNFASLPATGESGKIYITKDTNLTYRWTGSGYAEISPSIALGETSSTAYRGDRGKIAYDHSQTTHQSIINGTGFVKASGTTITYDNTSYLPLAGGTMSNANLVTNLNAQYLNGIIGHNLDAYTKAIKASGYDLLIQSGDGYHSLFIGYTGALTYDNYTIWHAGNDGSGSGLDADLLDGLDSGKYFKVNAALPVSNFDFHTGDIKIGTSFYAGGNGTGNTNFPVYYGQIVELGNRSGSYGHSFMFATASDNNTLRFNNCYLYDGNGGGFGGWKDIYHSGNSNKSDVDWSLKSVLSYNHDTGAILVSHNTSAGGPAQFIIQHSYSDVLIYNNRGANINFSYNNINVGGSITASGFAGIGYTSDPTSGNKLAVNGNGYFGGTYLSIGSNAYSSIKLDISTIIPTISFGTQGSYIAYDYHDNEQFILNSRYFASKYSFRIAGTEKMSINGNGSLLVGYTADPTSGNKLAVNGTAYINGNITAQIATLTGCNTQSVIIKDSGNTTRWTVSYNTSTYALEFKNASGVLECSIDQSGNLKAKGEVTAYATI